MGYYIMSEKKYVTKREKLSYSIKQAIGFEEKESAKKFMDNLSIDKCSIFEIKETNINNKVDFSEKEYLDNLLEISTNINILHDSLLKSLSTIDKSITDIYHYIEFSEFNAVDGYKAYKILHDKLKERRTIKDRIEKINLLTPLVSSKNIRSASKGINTLETKNKVYNPRVMDELFPINKDNK